MAADKIGITKFRDALQSRNPWPAMKSLGSQPKVNFLFVKPDKLEQHIRRRARNEFKALPADKKSKQCKQKLEGCDIDPFQLQLIERNSDLEKVRR